MHLKSCSLRGQQDKPLIALENSPPYRLSRVLRSSTGSVGCADAGRLQQSRRKGDFRQSSVLQKQDLLPSPAPVSGASGLARYTALLLKVSLGDFCRYQQRFGLLLAAFMGPGHQRSWHQEAPEKLQQAGHPPPERCGAAADSRPRRLG